MNTSMEDNITYVEITAWTPSYVTTILATGSEHYIGFVDETTVLKYPHLPNESDGITVEAQILRRLSPHPRIIEFKGKTNEGILIERAANGSVADLLFGKDGAASELLPHPRERLRWAREAAEAVAYIHSKHVIHRDISVGNLLLDKDMHIKLADFQGLLLNPDGTTEAEGNSWEGTRSSMPRENKDQSDARTDIFALGSSIYTIMLQRVPYHDLDSRMDEDEIERQFRQGEFPSIEVELGGEVVHKCWRGDYNSAEELVADLVKLEMSSSVESTRDDYRVSGMISTDETGDTCRLSVPNLMPITVNQS